MDGLVVLRLISVLLAGHYFKPALEEFAAIRHVQQPQIVSADTPVQPY